jgi:V/A-type H+-transporting ATPase subunit D
VALKIQYNKTYQQRLQKELAIRERALPTLQAKETALRLEVKKARTHMQQLRERLEQLEAQIEHTYKLWCEFPGELVTVEHVDYTLKKIAGVRIPLFNEVRLTVDAHSLVYNQAWVPEGIHILEQIVSLKLQLRMVTRQTEILEYARKKTTQKVNLYEKVQIPAYRDGILKIKRFLEDKENLEKSAQKILKSRLAAQTEGAS